MHFLEENRQRQQAPIRIFRSEIMFLLGYAGRVPIMEDIQTTDPATRRIVHAALDRELLTHGMDSTGPIKDDLLGRVRILRGYRGEPTVRLIDDTRTLVPPDAYLDQVMNRKPDYVPPKSPTGPMRIAMSDKRGLLTGDITRIGRGEIIVFDDRSVR